VIAADGNLYPSRITIIDVNVNVTPYPWDEKKGDGEDAVAQIAATETLK
jgi:hypothetical protein